MIITMCCSMKFPDEIALLEKELKRAGYTVFMPVRAPGVDYWALDNTKRVKAKRGMNLIQEHMNKIEKSDAILVANYTKREIKNYIGANTFMEMGFAHHLGKKIFVLNSFPDQPYIKDELETFDAVILDGDLSNIK